MDAEGLEEVLDEAAGTQGGAPREKLVMQKVTIEVK